MSIFFIKEFAKSAEKRKSPGFPRLSLHFDNV